MASRSLGEALAMTFDAEIWDPGEDQGWGRYKADDDYEHTDADAPPWLALQTPAGPADPSSVFESRWVNLGDSPRILIDQPPPQDWLLTRYDDGRSVGVFPRGKVGLLTGSGGTGKTMALAQLALAIASGGFWLDTFRVARPGHVLLALAEEDLLECTRRLWRACNALELSADERREIAGRIHLLPLHGVPVSLLNSPAPSVYEKTKAANDLRIRLEAAGVDWSAVIFDPLSRWAGAGAERDNEAATRFIQTVEELIAVRGGPSAIIAHHSSKLSVGSGYSDARGVSGLRDAVRWMATLDVVKAEGAGRAVRLHNDKSNYSREFEDLILRRSFEPGAEGTLRLATAEETELFGNSGASRQKAKIEKARGEFEARCERILFLLPARPAFASLTYLESALRGSGHPVTDKTLKVALEHLASELGGHRAIDLSNGAQSKPRQWART